MRYQCLRLAICAGEPAKLFSIEEMTMSLALRQQTSYARPAIDQAAPAEIRTATFALG